MRKMSTPATISLAAAAAVALVLTGAACSQEGGADATPADLATAEFQVEGMTCGGCALATEMAVKKLDGVASADAEYDEATEEGRCTVEYDPERVTTDRIAAAIEEAGFMPTLASESSTGAAPPTDEGGR